MKKLLFLSIVLVLLSTTALGEAGLDHFSTTDIEGHTVTQDIFADYDLTIVNVWATWCPTCLQEMPYLSQLKEKLPENINFITLCEDASLDLNLVKDILHDAGANYQTLIVNQEIMDGFMNQVYFFPSTFFLDCKGIPVTDPIGPVDPNNFVDTYYTVAMSILDMIKE